jgi:uncharacterized Zn finger protein (UPF0148 family)
MSQENKALSFIERMKLKAQSQRNYGGEIESKNASMKAVTCENCGAGRAKNDGLTKCAYCGFEFISTELSDGLYIKKEDNSR